MARVCSSGGAAVQAEQQGGFDEEFYKGEHMRMAVQEVAAETMAACKDPLVKKQLAYLLGRQGVVSRPSICGASLSWSACVAHAWNAAMYVPATLFTAKHPSWAA